MRELSLSVWNFFKQKMLNYSFKFQLGNRLKKGSEKEASRDCLKNSHFSPISYQLHQKSFPICSAFPRLLYKIYKVYSK